MSKPAQVECTIPILSVADLSRSVKFYTEKLGFVLDWGDAQKDRICSVSRDGKAIMLATTTTPVTPTWVWIGIDNASIFEEFRSQGVKVFQEPRNFSWAYEMKFEDLDGNVLWLGTDSRQDIPLEDRA